MRHSLIGCPSGTGAGEEGAEQEEGGNETLLVGVLEARTHGSLEVGRGQDRANDAEVIPKANTAERGKNTNQPLSGDVRRQIGD